MTQPLRSRFLMRLEADLAAPQDLGPKQIYTTLGGRFEGPRLRGTVLPGGGDWLFVRPGGIMVLDIRITLRTDDGGLILATYPGRLVQPPEMAAMTAAEAAAFDPARYYFRSAPTYETASAAYGWINAIVAVGIGRPTATGVAWDVHEVL